MPLEGNEMDDPRTIPEQLRDIADLLALPPPDVPLEMHCKKMGQCLYSISVRMEDDQG
jgi:hypothetical protein